MDHCKNMFCHRIVHTREVFHVATKFSLSTNILGKIKKAHKVHTNGVKDIFQWKFWPTNCYSEIHFPLFIQATWKQDKQCSRPFFPEPCWNYFLVRHSDFLVLSSPSGCQETSKDSRNSLLLAKKWFQHITHCKTVQSLLYAKLS